MRSRRGGELDYEKSKVAWRLRQHALRDREVLDPLKEERERLHLRRRELASEGPRGQEGEEATELRRQITGLGHRIDTLQLERRLEELRWRAKLWRDDRMSAESRIRAKFLRVDFSPDPPAPVTEIPAVGRFGFASLALLLALFGVLGLRHRG